MNNNLSRLLGMWILNQLGPAGYIDPNTDEAVLGPMLCKREMLTAAVALLQAEQAADPKFLPNINLAAIQADLT